jgi:hypothetical protein
MNYQLALLGGVTLIDGDTRISIPFSDDNTDYQTFKKEINDQTAQLEDADGNLMTAQQAIDYVATLP